jgi:hypothetical protein
MKTFSFSILMGSMSFLSLIFPVWSSDLLSPSRLPLNTQAMVAFTGEDVVAVGPEILSLVTKIREELVFQRDFLISIQPSHHSAQSSQGTDAEVIIYEKSSIAAKIKDLNRFLESSSLEDLQNQKLSFLEFTVNRLVAVNNAFKKKIMPDHGLVEISSLPELKQEFQEIETRIEQKKQALTKMLKIKRNQLDKMILDSHLQPANFRHQIIKATEIYQENVPDAWALLHTYGDQKIFEDYTESTIILIEQLLKQGHWNLEALLSLISTMRLEMALKQGTPAALHFGFGRDEISEELQGLVTYLNSHTYIEYCHTLFDLVDEERAPDMCQFLLPGNHQAKFCCSYPKDKQNPDGQIIYEVELTEVFNRTGCLPMKKSSAKSQLIPLSLVEVIKAGASGTAAISDASVRVKHTSPAQIQAGLKVLQLFLEKLHQSKKPKTAIERAELQKNIMVSFYLLAQVTPHNRGGGWIAEVYFKGLMRHFGFPVGPWKKEIIPWAEAAVRPLSQFLKIFPTLYSQNM